MEKKPLKGDAASRRVVVKYMRGWLAPGIVILLFAVIVAPLPRVAAQDLLYQRTWGDTSNDSGAGPAVDSSGNVYVTGSTNSSVAGSFEAVVLKFDSSGMLQWQKTWGGANLDYGWHVTVDFSGNIYVVGSTYSFGAGTGDVLVLKFDSSGMLQWQKTWGGANRDTGRGVAVDSSGNVYVTGTTRSFGAGFIDAILLKCDSSGMLLWAKTWGGAGGEEGYGVAVDSSGDIYVTGITESFGAGELDAFLLKFDSSGLPRWQKTWGGGDSDFGHGVAVDSSGDIYVAGDTFGFGADGDEVVLLKFDSSGMLLWAKTWGASMDDEGLGVAVGPAGDVYVTGVTNSFGAGASDAFLLKFDSSGVLQWQKTWGGAQEDSGGGVAVGSSGVWVVGSVGGAPPYSFASANGSLGVPAFSVGVPSFTLGRPSSVLGSPSGMVATPSGSLTYAGGSDVFLIEVVSELPPTTTTTTTVPATTTTTRTTTSTTATTMTTITTVPVASFASATAVLVVMSLSVAVVVRRRRHS